jgi:hypothetical protein
MDHPSLVTNDPYGEGWLMSISCSVLSPSTLKFYTAEKQGFFVIRATGSSSSIVNEPGFQPKAF